MLAPFNERIGVAVATAVLNNLDGVKVTCSSCGHQQKVMQLASVPPQQIITLTMTPSSGSSVAETVGGTISHFAKLLKALVRDAGSKVSVFLHDINRGSDGAITLEFAVIRDKHQTKRKS